MNKTFHHRNFSNVETRRNISLIRNSSAAEAEKFDRQVSANAGLRSADLREYWQSGTDRNNYLNETEAREANEANHSIPSPSDYVIQLNQTRSVEDKVGSFSDLTEVKTMMFKTQVDIKNSVKRKDWKLYQTRRQTFRDDNAWLIAQLMEMIDPNYLQFFIDTQHWEKEVSKNKSFEIKLYLQNRNIDIHGSTATAVKRQEELWLVEFGNVSNYEAQICENEY